jgi:methionyl-tRNA synthetase
VLFLCGTDEHGTPAELAAQAAGLPVAEYCARQHAVQADIYRRFGLSFDQFSRTSGEANRRLTQEIFHALDAAGFIEERTIRQAYSPTDRRFLPDRYVVGTCPHCGSANARGDQCENCTRLLDPDELLAPRSAVSGATDIEFRDTRHLFLKLSALDGRLRDWLATRRDWPPLVRSIAAKWLDEGLRDRCITRDLDWGVPVPKPGFENKVFYVWFDAPIGYIAATAESRTDWRDWWQADDVRYLQFLAKDNVPFHAISFPATLLGSGLPFKPVDVIKGFNWLTYEGGKFSTSGRRGIFTDAALAWCKADYWRWWLATNAPEGADCDFTIERFVDGVNKDLGDVLGNLVNRCLSFATARFDARVPCLGEPGPLERKLAAELDGHLRELRKLQEGLALRKAAEETRAIWKLGNAYLSEAAPWTAIKSDPGRAATIVHTGIDLVRVAALAAWPFIPFAAEEVLECLGEPVVWPEQRAALVPGRRLRVPPVLFPRISAACRPPG